MRTRRTSALFSGMTALGLAVCLVSGCAIEQLLIGQWYIIHTPQAGACPRLEWRFVVNPQRAISGSLSRDGQQPVATLSGLLNADDSFQITARAVAGDRTADVNGQFTSQVSTISIRGDGAGQACNGQTYKLRLGGYFASQGGAFGGGG